MARVSNTVPNNVVGVHLQRVIWQMRDLGLPALQVYDPRDGGPIIALEGSHRLAAAHALDLPVRLIRKDLNDNIAHDFGDLKTPCSVQQVVEYLQQSEDREHRPVYTLREVSHGRHVAA